MKSIEQTIAIQVAAQLAPQLSRLADETARLRRELLALKDKPMSLKEVCEKLGKSKPTIVKYFEEGSLLGVQRNGIYYFMPSDVESFLESPRRRYQGAVA